MERAPNVKVEFTEVTCINHLQPVRDAPFVFGGKWKLQIIIVLRSGNKRFNELQRTIEGSYIRKASSQKLRMPTMMSVTKPYAGKLHLRF